MGRDQLNDDRGSDEFVFYWTPTTAVLGLVFPVVALYGMVADSPFVAAAGFFGSAALAVVANWRARRRTDRAENTG